MCPVIRIPDDLYRRLERHANGFDTPSNVIEKLLNVYEGAGEEGPKTPAEDNNIQAFVAPSSLEILYHPGPEETFKERFLESKLAYIKLYYTDGTTKDKVWKAGRFSESSSVKGNLLSGYLRGWRDKGIFKAELVIDLEDISE